MRQGVSKLETNLKRSAHGSWSVTKQTKDETRDETLLLLPVFAFASAMFTQHQSKGSKVSCTCNINL